MPCATSARAAGSHMRKRRCHRRGGDAASLWPPCAGDRDSIACAARVRCAGWERRSREIRGSLLCSSMLLRAQRTATAARPRLEKRKGCQRFSGLWLTPRAQIRELCTHNAGVEGSSPSLSSAPPERDGARCRSFLYAQASESVDLQVVGGSKPAEPARNCFIRRSSPCMSASRLVTVTCSLP
jgi:hypothetical protein